MNSTERSRLNCVYDRIEDNVYKLKFNVLSDNYGQKDSSQDYTEKFNLTRDLVLETGMRMALVLIEVLNALSDQATQTPIDQDQQMLKILDKVRADIFAALYTIRQDESMSTPGFCSMYDEDLLVTSNVTEQSRAQNSRPANQVIARRQRIIIYVGVAIAALIAISIFLLGTCRKLL
ncbi:hypothetical protein ACOME3_008718 [Neoechinorhynchus agilis]